MTKRIVTLLLTALILSNLTGCIPVTTDEYYEISQSVEQITAIALYERNYDPNSQVNELHETPLAEISEDNFAEFVSELESIYSRTGFYITIAAQDPSFHFDRYVIRIDYSNGDQEFISNGGYQEIIAVEGNDKGYHYSFNDEQWDSLLLKYFSIQKSS